MPKAKKVDPAKVQAALNLKFKKKDSDSGAKTLREYLQKLLVGVWVEGESFSGKRPFGNSDWQGDIEFHLVQAGLIDGEIEGGELYESDSAQADALILAVIEAVFAEPA